MEARPSTVAYALGGLLPIAAAAAMVGLRGELASTNVALVLVLVVWWGPPRSADADPRH